MPEQTSQESIDKLIERAARALPPLDPEELQQELKQFDYEFPGMETITQAAQAPQVFEGGEEARQQPPPGFKEKSLALEVMEVPPAISGALQGAFKAAAALYGPQILREVTGVDFGKLPEEKRQIKEVWKTKKDIDQEFIKRHGQDAFTNIQTDLRDNVEAILMIAEVIRDSKDFIPEHMSSTEHLMARESAGEELGQHFVTGMSADILKLGEDPLRWGASRPVTAAMILAPQITQIKNLASGNFTPAVNLEKSKRFKAIDKMVNTVATKLRESETGAKVVRQAQQAKIKAVEKAKSLKRMLDDPIKHTDDKLTDFLERVIVESKERGEAITAVASRYGKIVAQGFQELIGPPSEIWTPLPISTKEGITFKVKKLKEAGIPEERILETWETPEATKTLTNEYDYNPTTANIGIPAEHIRAIAERPAYESTIRAEAAKPKLITISNTHWREAVDNFLAELVRIENVNPLEVKQILNKKLSKKSTGILISKVLKKQILDSITTKVRESQALSPPQFVRFKDALSKFIDRMNKRDPSSANFERNALINIGGKEPIYAADGTIKGYTDPVLQISLADEVLSALDKNPKLRNTVYGELITESALDIAGQAKQNAIKRIAEEHIGSSTTNSEWIDQALDTLSQGEEVPGLIAHNPNQISSMLVKEAEFYSLESGVPVELIRDLAHKITSYKRVPIELIDRFGFSDHLQKVHERKGRTPEIFEKELFAPEGVIESLKYEHNSIAAVQEATSWQHSLVRDLKLNMTALNLAAGLNNIRANFGYQTFRRADPLLAKDLIQMAKDYNTWRSGEYARPGKKGPFQISAEQQSFFQAMERTGYLNTTALDLEMGGFGTKSGLFEKLGKPGRVLSTALKKIYKGGDNIFKLEDAWYNYKNLVNDLKDLEQGRWIKLQIGPRKVGKVWKEYDGYVLQIEGQPVRNRIRLSKNQLDDVLVRSSAQPGQNIFFDYSDVSNLIKAVRASKALGVTSMFFTWFWKAIDIPGIKKGLIWHLMNDSVIYGTDSPILNRRLAGKNALSSIKKATVLAGLREAVKNDLNDDTLRKVLAYSPKEMNLQLLKVLTSPMYIGHDSEQSSNQFDPSDIILRFGQTLMAETPPTGLGPEGQKQFADWMAAVYPTEEGKYGQMIDFDLGTIEDPEVKRDIIIRRKLFKKHHAGEAFTPQDFARLVAISGNPILDTILIIDKAGKPGKVLDYRKLAQLTAMAIMGGTAARSLDVAAGANKATRFLSTRKWAENPISKPQEDFVRWAMRRVTGIGYRPLDVAKRSKWYFRNKEIEWKNSLTNRYKEMLENPQLPMTSDDRINIQKRIVELNRIVEGEMVLEKIHFEEVYKKIGELVKKSQKKK